MTERDVSESQRAELADTFDLTADPLRAVAEKFSQTSVDPFVVFTETILSPRDLAPATLNHFAYVFDEWRSHMQKLDRHPACPAVEHVEAYITAQLASPENGGKGNAPRTVKEKLRKLNRAYRYWQQDPVFPHEEGYNPFTLARQRVPLSVTKHKEHRKIPLSELREMVASVTNLRARAIVLLQLKLGLRAGEVANLRLGDFRMNDADSTTWYSCIGTHSALDTHHDVVYIPSRDERDGNKSVRPRLLPLDAETRVVLDRYLFVRPNNGEPWLFLSKKSHTQMTTKGVNQVWKDAFHPKYAGTDDHRPVTSHFGRHRFTTFWRVEQDVNRQLVKYMRGDRTGSFTRSHGLDAYLHAYYEDIEELYRSNIYTLGESLQESNTE